jgi:hypothetical protein
MRSRDVSPADARDRGLQRLRAWTTVSVALAAGLTALFAFLAAGSFPGRAAAASAADPPSTPAAQSSDDQGFIEPQAPAQGFFGPGGGTGGGGVRSGGS